MTLHSLALEARDGFFCKDGRGWTTSAVGRARSLDWPFPSTVRGALRTAWGLSHESVQGVVLERDAWPQATSAVTIEGLWPLRRERTEAWQKSHRLWPTPLDAFYPGPEDASRHVLRLQPSRGESEPHTLGQGDDDAIERLWQPCSPSRSKPGERPPWWPERDFGAWLRGQDVLAHDDTARLALTLARRRDVHVGIDPETLTARDKLLYSIEVVEPGALAGVGVEWAIGAAANWPEAAGPLARSVVALGGDRRMARADILDWDLRAVVDGLLDAVSEQQPRGLRLFIVTPAHFRGGWLLPGFEPRDGAFGGRLIEAGPRLLLRAALVPRPLHLSGWDMAAGAGGRPKRTRRLVPPGAVYFLEKADGSAFTAAEFEALWLCALGADCEDGLGRVVPGVWHPPTSQPGIEETP